MQILVFVILATSWWIYTLVKRKTGNFRDNEQNLIDETHTHQTKPRRQFRLSHKHIARYKDVTKKYATKAQDKSLHIVEQPEETIVSFDTPNAGSQGKAKNKSARKRGEDLGSGMEMLELDFLLSIVENTEGDGKNDVTMRKLIFNELLRRENQKLIDGSALKIYAMNQANLYSKNIQCEAMRELAERTARKSKHSG